MAAIDNANANAEQNESAAKVKAPWMIPASGVILLRLPLTEAEQKDKTIAENPRSGMYASLLQSYVDDLNKGRTLDDTGVYRVDDVIFEILANTIGATYNAKPYTGARHSAKKPLDPSGWKAETASRNKQAFADLLTACAMAMATGKLDMPEFQNIGVTWAQYSTGERGTSNGIDAKMWILSVAKKVGGADLVKSISEKHYAEKKHRAPRNQSSNGQAS